MYIENYKYSILSDLNLPVIICEKTKNLPIKYMNMKADLFLYSMDSASKFFDMDMYFNLEDILLCEKKEYESLCLKLDKSKYVDGFRTGMNTLNGDKNVILSLKQMSNGDILVYLTEDVKYEDHKIDLGFINHVLVEKDVNKVITSILELAGIQTQVSRAYIFEHISPPVIGSTYEWYAEGTESLRQNLRDLNKSDCINHVLMDLGMCIIDDIHILSDSDRQIFEMQRIKSTALFVLYAEGNSIGYIGFDDFGRHDRWTEDQIIFLRTIASLITTFIICRDTEMKMERTQQILQLLSDNSDEIVYVNSLEDYTLKFVSGATERAFGKSAVDMIGKPCWKALYPEQDGPCVLCSMPKINFEPGQERSEDYISEQYCAELEKYFLIKDSIIKWVDGEYVHLKTAVDITYQIEYQKKLRIYASMDALLGIYNRMWGSRLLEEKLNDKESIGSLSFVDVDGLKIVNDALGHQAGDKLLLESVDLIQSILPKDSLICRWGGDEFVIWTAQPVEQTKRMFDKLKQRIEQVNKDINRKFPLSFSYGVMPFIPGSDTSLDHIITQADRKMYEDKMIKKGLFSEIEA